MSVYKRKGKDTYSYDFQLRGRRFSGDTGATQKREAEAFERRQRDAARAQLSQEKEFFSEDMTFEIAASRWYIEVGQHNSGTDTTLRNLDWLKRYIGASTRLRDIDDSRVASLVARRRGERIKGKADAPLVSNATVNRTCTVPLREIITRARKVWKIPVSDIDFGQHMLKEPQERVREASIEEEEAILAQLAPGYDAAVEFAILSGCRRMEILGLEWPHVDFFSRRFTVTGKGGKVRVIPMSDAIFNLLWAQKDFHPLKVFTFVSQRTLKPLGYIKGKRYPLQESGLKTAMRRAVPKAGVSNFRFHDTRHTAATRTLRVSNLRVVQNLLGHSDPKTTAKYAHAVDDDIRNALNAAATKSPTRNPTQEAGEADKTLKTGEKSD